MENIPSIFLLGFKLVRCFSSALTRSGLLHSEIAFHLPLWQIILSSLQVIVQPQHVGFLEQNFWQVCSASSLSNRNSLGKSNILITLVLMLLQVTPSSFCWNSLGNTEMQIILILHTVHLYECYLDVYFNTHFYTDLLFLFSCERKK